MKKANVKRLNTVRFHLYEILERQNYGDKDQWLQGGEERGDK